MRWTPKWVGKGKRHVEEDRVLACLGSCKEQIMNSVIDVLSVKCI